MLITWVNCGSCWIRPIRPGRRLPSKSAKKYWISAAALGQTLIAICPYRQPGEGGLCVTCSRTDCPPWGYGIDIDRSAVALGRKWSKRMVLASSAAENLPFPDREFDLVFARVSLAYTRLPEAVREIRRVLKPGGRIWLTLHSLSLVRRKPQTPRNWKGRLFLFYVLLNGLLFHLTLRTITLFGRCESWQSASAMKRLLERSGFHGIEIREIGHRLEVSARG